MEANKSQDLDGLILNKPIFLDKKFELIVSIINISEKNFQFLVEALDSMPQDFADNMLVIVTMVRPTEEQIEHVFSYELPIAIIRRKKLLSFAKNHNNVFKNFSGEVYWMLNDDIKVIGIDWHRILSDFNSMQCVGAVSPTVKNKDQSIQNIVNTRWGVVTAMMTVFDLHRRIKKIKEFSYSKRYHDRTDLIEVEAIAGVAPFIKGAVFERCGYLDEVTRYWGEDKEFFLRMSKCGYKVLIDSEQELLHYGGQSTGVNKGKKSSERLDFPVMRLVAIFNYLDKNKGKYTVFIARLFVLTVLLIKINVLRVKGGKDISRIVIVKHLSRFLSRRARYCD